MIDKKPKWLKALEAQSWQAELIASGLAIYGSLSLGTYIDHVVDWALVSFNERVLKLLSYLFIYVYVAHAIMVVSFIAHLILRIVWAGILGLSSVFPKGINTESNAYPNHFKEALKKDYPSLSQYSLELDKLCSMIFSILCAMVIIFVNISLLIFGYLILSFFLLKFLPEAVVNGIGYALIFIVLFISFSLMFLTQGKFKNSALSKKYAYKLNTVASKVLYPMGGKSYNFIMQTIRTNSTAKSFYVGMFVIIFGSMAIAMPKIMSGSYLLYHQKAFANFSPESAYAIKNNYEDLKDADYILHPFIQSEIIKDDFIKLYIPLYEREKPVINKLCIPYQWNDDISRQENRKLRAIRRNKCANRYYNITLNGRKIEIIDFQFRDDIYNGKDGYRVFLNIDSLNIGSHELRIESAYKTEDHTFIRTIPFYKTKN